MGFKLCSDIAIGNYFFRGGVNEVKIKRSVKDMIDTAVMKIPAFAQTQNIFAVLPLGIPGLTSPPQNAATSIETSKFFKEGDKVTIQLGYNDKRLQEFKGFIRRVSPEIPCLIECEGYAYQLRKKPFTGSWKTVSLKEFLTELVKDTDIVLSKLIPQYTLTNICIKNGNALAALQYVQGKTHLAVFFHFETLYFGLEQAYPGKPVEFRLGWNTRGRNNLKYRLASNDKILVRMVAGKGKNNKRVLVEVGDKGGTVFTENIAFIKDEHTLREIANGILLRYKYTGFEGAIDCFMQPFCQPGDTAIITDQPYKVRDGSYFINGIDITFGMNGGLRKVQLGRALSVPNFEKQIKP
jgi:hypothetical protein